MDDLTPTPVDADDRPVEAPTAATAAVPAVAVVLVTHDPGAWFEETLRSIADQTYPDLAVLVVDTDSAEDPTERVHAVLPDAIILRLPEDPGYGAATNLVLDAVEGASFYALCHDDIALEPDAIRAMVEESFRSNAGIVGPKLVDWHEPRRILQVGMGVDKTGVLAPIAEPGELDQEQHDAVRDVFVVPSACMVVRADLFRALDGFDEGIDHLGDDLDLCWRAHLLGARVLIAPVARVRHLQALALRHPEDDRRRAFARHRLRTTLIAYGRFHRLRVIPQAFVLALLEALFAVITGRPGHSRDILGAWSWNLRRRGQIRRRRKAVATDRRVSDREIRGMQVRGSARFNAFVRSQLHRREDGVDTFSRSSRDLFGSVRESSRQFTGAFALVLIVILAISTRSLVTGGIPAIGEFSRFPGSASDFFRTYLSGWRSVGLGSPGAQPGAFGLLGLASTLFLGATSVLRSVLVLGTIPVGALGAWRLARPIGSARASVAAFAVYLALPVPYNALASGSWSGLTLYAASPWLLLLLARASGIAPYGPLQTDSGTRPSRRRALVPIVTALGLIVAIVAAFVPFVLVIVPVMAVALTLGTLLCFRVGGAGRLLLAGAIGVALAVLLNAPWSLELVRARQWSAFTGVGRSGGDLGIGQLLRFETGPWGAPPLGFAFLLAGVLPILIGRSWRLEWAVRSWFVVLAGWGVLWASSAGHLGIGLPAPEVILAPTAAALALTAALGLASFERDLRAYGFGWRQIVSVLAALGVALGAMPLGSGLIDGRWRTPTADFVESQSSITGAADPDEGAARILWLGDADLLPVDGWRYDDTVAFSATEIGEPTVLDRFAPIDAGSTHLLADIVRTAERRRTNRLGHLLAPMGIRYIVVTEHLAPSTSRMSRPLPGTLERGLRQQLDLAEIPLREGVTVYENTAWAPFRSVLPEGDSPRNDYSLAVGEDLDGASPALTEDVGAVGARGRVPESGQVSLGTTADEGWKLTVDGVPATRSTVWGWSQAFTTEREGPARLGYDTPLGRRAAMAGQVLLWVVVLAVRRRSRTNERRREMAESRISEVRP